MTEFHPNLEIPRDPEKAECLEAHIDVQLLELYGRIEEVLPYLVEPTDPDAIRVTLLPLVRVAYGKGATDVYNDPAVLLELLRIYKSHNIGEDL